MRLVEVKQIDSSQLNETHPMTRMMLRAMGEKNPEKVVAKHKGKKDKKEKKKVNEAETNKARWVKDRGPEDIGVWELHVPAAKGWRSLGFVVQHKYPTPPTSGTLKLHNMGLSSEKNPIIDLDNYNFE